MSSTNFSCLNFSLQLLCKAKNNITVNIKVYFLKECLYKWQSGECFTDRKFERSQFKVDDQVLLCSW